MTSPNFISVSFPTLFFTGLSYLMGFVYGLIHHFILQSYYGLQVPPPTPKGYVPLWPTSFWFFHRWMFGRIYDCWNRPITSAPGPWIDIVEAKGSLFFDNFRFDRHGSTQHCLNLGSYNYLGFSQTSGPCLEDVERILKIYSVSSCSPPLNYGRTPVHIELEKQIANFLGKEDAIAFGMGYATNATTLYALVGQGGLMISDSFNHASIIIGMRCSRGNVRIFDHNDPKSLEQVIRDAVSEGQPGTGKPWTKILIVVEGIYSMEGEIVRLPEIIALKKKYKAYLYLDEAHSIGALGSTGRGVCDYYGIDHKEIDILMGTFTKSFASAGGYIVGSKELISYIRATSFSSFYDVSMPIGTAQQVISTLSIIEGKDNTNDGLRRIQTLRQNSNYFRTRLAEEGFIVGGDLDSPIIPILLCNPNKMSFFTRACLENHIGVVIAGFPATPALKERARFCISAAHTKEDLEEAVQRMAFIGRIGTLVSPTPQSKFQWPRPKPWPFHIEGKDNDKLEQKFKNGLTHH